MTARGFGCSTGLGLIFLVAGCATPPQRVVIPTGEWSGRGAFIADTWTTPAGGGKPVGERQQYGRYPTQLKIGPAEGNLSGRVRIEIMSAHGLIENMDGDRTHLVAELEPRTPLPDAAFGVYRLTQFGVSFDEQPPDMEPGPEGPTHATCMVVDGSIVLTLRYLDGFTDTLWFRGDAVVKNGTWSSEKGDGFIHWTEVLRRLR